MAWYNFIKNYRAWKERREAAREEQAIERIVKLRELECQKFCKDVEGSIDSILHTFGKEFRYNPKVTVGEALNNIILDIDAMSAGQAAPGPHFYAAVNVLGLEEVRGQPLVEYFAHRELRQRQPNHDRIMKEAHRYRWAQVAD